MSGTIQRGLLARLICIVFLLVVNWISVCLLGVRSLGYCVVGIPVIVVETIIQFMYRSENVLQEYYWFSHIIIIVIACTTPPLNLVKAIQLKHVDRMNAHYIDRISLVDSSKCLIPPLVSELDYIVRIRDDCFYPEDHEHAEMLIKYFGHVCNYILKDWNANVTWKTISLENACTYTRIYFQINMMIGMHISEVASTMFLEHAFILVLLIVRWMIPQRGVSYVELGQLLFFTITAGSDILEYQSGFLDIRNVKILLGWGYWIFTFIYSVSLAQFFFNINARTEHDDTLDAIDWSTSTSEQKIMIIKDMLLSTDMWAMLLGACIQDLTFGVSRLWYISFQQERLDKVIFFFTKNVLMIMLDCVMIYEKLITYFEKRRGKLKEVEEAQYSAYDNEDYDEDHG